ncbi:SMP-30/gluconolactonase/LRE family protein [Chroogloeocystis siderophila]|jgi:sugar lactone lactonase YvrE|uniref:Gluconolaconase n=1 Tax=Chroogloeocystis siderophila 5.2 s.c.1 TaxID=247279 RepID=A0A1U7HJG3_9CHRO|nr:SMP-30/gluconolactonase/LRE family protein [Chroogloeocystis siderophila]OKH23694.1 gluconolaconase [Chroogloeocystis siderophila 5.2 s.c.1]
MINFIDESPKNILTARARLGEGPCWHLQKQLLYWVDIYNHRVHEFNSTTGEQKFFDVGEVVGCIAPAKTNRLIMALRHRLAFLDTSNGEVTPIIDVETEKPSDIRLNDGKCDPAGRFWFGSMSTSGSRARLFRYDPDGSLHVVLTGLTVSNGLGWSPDQKTFYLTDSPTKKIYAFDFDVASGDINNQRVFAAIDIDSGVPDGLTVDRDGCIWSAIWDGWCVVKFDPTGTEMARISMPVQRPTCCVFGNQDLATLYITTASVGLSEEEIQKSFYSGDLFSLATNTSGMPTYEFAG